jgi:hypothetical protein
MDENREEILAKRAKLKNEYGQLFDSVAEILFRDDPAEINFGFNQDENEPEAETILPRLKNCHSSEDVLNVVREELQKWFDQETTLKENNRIIAEEIWTLWQNRKLV